MERNDGINRMLLVEAAEGIAGGTVSPAYHSQDRLEATMHLAATVANFTADTTLSARHMLAITHIMELAYTIGRADGRKDRS